ncbi:hypothetical protein GCM10023169_26160 [Georgenia halophila]|uniref:DUF1353 domain-containing protein n=1 Tax=Georgenia halophila TaxID=620889 RepID=A0ABP8LDF8_9MICO
MAGGHFYDVLDGGPLRLEMRSIDGNDFTLLRQFGYRGDDHDQPFVVPADLDTFSTDLASVPGVFVWLVPKSGDFLPAAVLHDALVDGQHLGPRIDRVEADRVFRDAMICLGTGRVRAWMMWAGTSTATMWDSGRLALRLALVGVLGAIVALGTLSSVDLLDVWDVLPWMGDRGFGAELAGGAVAAVVVPAVLSLTWGRFWQAGMILGIALAVLLHVTVVIAVLFGVYLMLERLVSGPADRSGVRIRDRRASGHRP